MALTRRLLALLSLVLTAVAVWKMCWLPYACNRDKKMIEYEIAALYSQPAPDLAPQTRSLLQRIDDWRRRRPRDIDLLMERGACLRLLQQYAAAAASYRLALAHARRPEIFLNLAESELAAGNREAAIRALLPAARFDVTVLMEPEVASIRGDVWRQLTANFDERRLSNAYVDLIVELLAQGRYSEAYTLFADAASRYPALTTRSEFQGFGSDVTGDMIKTLADWKRRRERPTFF
jgi:tetratricopeptide (TPR) repeat protein